MPFRYVKGADGMPVMPKVRRPESRGAPYTDIAIQGMVDLIKKDADKAIDDLF